MVGDTSLSVQWNTYDQKRWFQYILYNVDLAAKSGPAAPLYHIYVAIGKETTDMKTETTYILRCNSDSEWGDICIYVVDYK